MKNFKRVLRSSVCFLVIFTMMMSSMVFAINVNNFEVVDFNGEVPYPIPQGQSVVVRIMFDGSGNVQENEDTHITIPTKFTVDANGITPSVDTETKHFVARNENLYFNIKLEVNSTAEPGNYSINLRNFDSFSSGNGLINNNLDLIIPFAVIAHEPDITTLDVTATAQNKTYNGNTDASITLQYNVGEDDVTVNYTNAYFETNNAGDNLLVTVEGLYLIGEDMDKYELASTTIATTADINKADAVINVEGKTVLYDGEVYGATGTAFGVNGEDLSGSLDLGNSFTEVPGGTAAWSFVGEQNYNDAAGSVEIEIGKADADISVPNVTVLYNGSPHGLTGTATGVNDVDLSNLLDLGDKFIEAGEETINWTFDGNTNHSAASGEATLTITEADLLVTAKSDSKVYDGEAFDNFDVAYDGFIDGEDASDLSGQLEWIIQDSDGETLDEAINAGTYTIIPSGLSSNNYDIEFVSTEITIQKANAEISVVGKTVTYDGNSHGATGTATGINDEDLSEGLDLGDTFSDAPGGDADWSFTGHTNYNDASGSVEIIIEKAVATITVPNIEVEYDGTSHGLDGTAIGVNDEDFSDLMDFGERFTDVPGGTATWTFPGSTNYLPDSGEATITIKKADLMVTAVDDTKVYDGDAFDNFGVTFDGFKGEDDVSVLEGDIQWEILDADGETVEEAVNAGTYTIIPSGLSSNNYNISYESAEITITKADAVITVEGIHVTYDGNAHGATGTATGVKGESLSGLLDLGDDFINVPGGAAYWNFAGNENYNEDSGSVAIVINKADAVINVPDVEVDYTGNPHSATGTAVGVNGEDLIEFMDFGESFTNAPGGTTDWSFEGSQNYNDASGTVAIQINRVHADITVSDISFGYDGTPHGLEGSAKGVQGEDLSHLLDFGDKFINVPGGSTIWTFAGDTNYLPDSDEARVTITEADLIVAAQSDSKVYDGTAFESFDVTITGFKGEDNATDLTGDLEWEIRDANGDIVEAAINAGTYTIIPSGLESINYNIDFQSAEISINPRPITIKALDAQKMYGETDLELEYEIKEGDLAEGDALTGSLSRELGQSVGTYEIRMGSLAINDVPENNNYDLTFMPGEFEITPRPITIAAKDASKVYGENDPELTYEITEGSLADGDGFYGNVIRKDGSNVGTYDINRGTLAINNVYDNNNYDLTFVDGEFTITARSITVTADDKSKVYGEDDPALNYSYDANLLVDGDEFTGSLTREEGEDVNTYVIEQGTLTLSNNYDLTFVDGEFTITARSITVTADDITKIYGADDPKLTYYWDEDRLIDGDTFEGALEREPGEEVGTYVINQGDLSLGDNYDLNFVDGTFSITYGIQGLFPPGSDDEIICFKTGRAIPLKWAYVDANGDVVDSSDFLLQVQFRPVDSDDDAEDITTPGNSSLSYNENTGTWQVNWHTKGMDSGVYELIIFDEETGQMDTFYIELK